MGLNRINHSLAACCRNSTSNFFFETTTMASSAASTPLNPGGDVLPIMVHVTAPATLPGGYTFEADLNGDPGKVFNCEVPEGGVQEGQVFLTPLPETFDNPRIDAPTGKWKDGLLNCCSLGFLHSSFWCALCCTQIAMAQVMARMQLTWLGEPGSLISTKSTYKVVLTLVVAYLVYSTALALASMPYAVGEAPALIPALKFFGQFLFISWSLYSLCRTRENVRARYQIPEERCVGCEDLCCSLWCSPCTVAQMARHTGEYENYPGVCCSETGHPPGTPLVV